MSSVASHRDDGVVAQMLYLPLSSTAQGLVLEVGGVCLHFRAVK